MIKTLLTAALITISFTAAAKDLTNDDTMYYAGRLDGCVISNARFMGAVIAMTGKTLTFERATLLSKEITKKCVRDVSSELAFNGYELQSNPNMKRLNDTMIARLFDDGTVEAVAMITSYKDALKTGKVMH